jgi:hypothetical protein
MDSLLEKEVKADAVAYAQYAFNLSKGEQFCVHGLDRKVAKTPPNIPKHREARGKDLTRLLGHLSGGEQVQLPC